MNKLSKSANSRSGLKAAKDMMDSSVCRKHLLEVQAQQIIKVFSGIKVADIPVEQPSKFELVINLKTAKAMGVTVYPALLLRADKLIE